MIKPVFYSTVLFYLLLTGCTKAALSENLSTSTLPADAAGFVLYMIPKGAHYANGNAYKETAGTVMKFTVRFDSSCIYRTAKAENQLDINKLYGFADNGANHQQFSARFGWRWSEGALRLFAYVYNHGERVSKEIAAVPIGKEVPCAITVNGGQYIFSVGEKTVLMPRQSATATAKGYQLYPYFGGDEPAPHEVRVWIRDEK